MSLLLSASCQLSIQQQQHCPFFVSQSKVWCVEAKPHRAHSLQSHSHVGSKLRQIKALHVCLFAEAAALCNSCQDKGRSAHRDRYKKTKVESEDVRMSQGFCRMLCGCWRFVIEPNTLLGGGTMICEGTPAHRRLRSGETRLIVLCRYLLLFTGP